jgi:hypothetical protein
MGYALIAPEIMIAWALRQYLAAKYLAKRHKERGWTMTHAFFLIMGGFTLHDKGTALRILEYRELETLSKAGKITWPSITKEEIQDRSKSDYLSKAFSVMHLGWFITQFIARCHYEGLANYIIDITELEILIFVFTLITGVICYLWWHKPYDVQCSVPVYLLDNENVVSEGILPGSPAANPLSELAHPGTSCEPVEGGESTQDVAFQFPISEESQPLQQPLIVSELDPDPNPHGPNSRNAIAPPAHGTQFLITEESQLLQQWALIVSKLDPDPSPHGPNPSDAIAPPAHASTSTQFLITEESQLLQQPLIVSELDPDPSPHGPNSSNAIAPPAHGTQLLITEESQLLQQPLIASKLDSDLSPQGPTPSNAKIYGTLVFPVITFCRTFTDMISSHKLDHSVPLCVPTFYSPNLIDVAPFDNFLKDLPAYVKFRGILGFSLMSAFVVIAGTIMIGNGFLQSKASPESWAWFIAMGISWLSSLFWAVLIPYLIIPNLTTSWFWGAFVPVTLSALFVSNRITFFILATIQLRALTPAQLAEIKWASILPHIKSG